MLRGKVLGRNSGDVMFLQIAIGTILLLATILIAGLSFGAMEWGFQRLQPWAKRAPHRPKLIILMCIASIWILGQFTAGVWLWAAAFMILEVFATLEESVYFALVAFTTLGFGDILLPTQWRLLSGMAAANGLLNIGLMTAILVEALRHMRGHQIAALKDAP